MKIIYNIIKLLLLILFLLLAIGNTHKTPFFYLPAQQIDAPLILILFCTFVIGVAFGMFALFGRLLGLRSENSRLRSEIKKQERLNKQNAETAPTAAPSAPQEAASPQNTVKE